MIITRAPLRIPLGGGGTDLPGYAAEFGGFILSAAIDKYVYVQLNTLKVEDFIRVKYSRTERVDDPAAIQHPLLRECLLHARLGGGVEISAMADIPGRTGMGSSGAFTVALLAALHAHRREHVSMQELAEEAYHVETARAGQPAGRHDHYLAAFGGVTCLEIETNGQVRVAPLQASRHTLEELRNCLLVFFTGIERESLDILGQQEADTRRHDPTVLDSLHAVKQLGYQVKAALEAGELDRFGRLLDQHWRTKKQRSGRMSNADIDRWYETALDAGALGGKIMGAGGGGFLLFYCPADRRAALRRTMATAGLREMSYQFDHEGARVLLHV